MMPKPSLKTRVSACCRSQMAMGTPEQPAEHQHPALLPVDVPAQRPEIHRLHAHAARHHQRDCIPWLQHAQEDATGDGGEGKTGKSRNECA